VRPTFELQEFPELIPEQPTPKTLGFFASLFRGKRDRLAEENRQALSSYLDELQWWQNRKEEFSREQQRRKQFIENELYTSVTAKSSYLGELLRRMAWPRETIVSTDCVTMGHGSLLMWICRSLRKCRTGRQPYRNGDTGCR